jgi:hypothetical protein
VQQWRLTELRLGAGPPLDTILAGLPSNLPLSTLDCSCYKYCTSEGLPAELRRVAPNLQILYLPPIDPKNLWEDIEQMVDVDNDKNSDKTDEELKVKNSSNEDDIPFTVWEMVLLQLTELHFYGQGMLYLEVG